jgi:hypothetical protein
MIQKRSLILLPLVVVMLFAGCAALQPPNAAGPTGAEQLYPVMLTEDSQAKEATLAALTRLTQPSPGSNLEPQLQPVTATIRALPASTNHPLYLPKVGATAQMSEEEIRESLRRFVRESRELIGADPTKLSLMARTDSPDGTKSADYEQRPFRYPIRGGYGKLRIRFGTDLRVIDLNSSCIPDADRIQTQLSTLTVRLKSEDAVQKLRENEISYVDPQGKRVSFRVSASSSLTPRELVTYIRLSKDRPDALEFRIAWEVEASGQLARLFYVDAVSGEILGAE